MAVVLTTDVTLNGGVVYLTVYEDTNGDGTSDNQFTVKAADGVNDVTLGGLSGGTGNDYWVDFTVKSGSVTDTPTVNSVVVDTNASAVANAGLVSDAQLNGGAVDVTVYEDIDADGTVENQTTVTIPDGTDQLTGLEGVQGVTGADYYLTASLSSGSVTDTPTVNSLTFNTVGAVTDAGSITAATATPQTPQETASLSDAAGVTGAAATLLTSAESAEATDAGILTAGAASPLTAGETLVISDPAGILSATASVLSATETVEDVISGTVTLNGSGVQGAKIYVINQDTDSVVGTATTDANGDYSVTVPATPPYHVAAQYDDGSQKYNALSKPWVE